MKQLSTFLLAFCVLGQAFVPAFWVLDYQWRHAAYLRHCENKNNAALHCDGKCYLRKRMSPGPVNDAKAPRLPDNFFSIKDLTLFCEATLSFSLASATPEPLRGAPFYRRFIPTAPVFNIFKPPAAARA